MVKMIVLVSSGTPILSVRLSVTSVPKTLMNMTVSQYVIGMYLFARNWKKSAIARKIPVIIEVPVRPKLRLTFKKSAAVSPTVVHITLINQNQRVISGTLLSITLKFADDMFCFKINKII